MTTFVDMARAPDQKSSEYGAAVSPAKMSAPIYPYGLCICLGKEELEKLGVDDSFEVDDIIDMRCFAKVTSVSKNATTDGTSVRVELQITHLAVENENEEDDDEEAGESTVVSTLGRRNPYK